MKIISTLFILGFIHLHQNTLCQEDLLKTGIEKAIPFPNTAVVLQPSWIQQREALNTSYLKSLDPDRLLHNFRVNAAVRN